MNTLAVTEHTCRESNSRITAQWKADDNIRECFVCGTRCMLMISGLKHHTRLVEGHSICLDLRTRMQFFAFPALDALLRGDHCGCVCSARAGNTRAGTCFWTMTTWYDSLSQNNMQSKGGMITFVIRNGTCWWLFGPQHHSQTMGTWCILALTLVRTTWTTCRKKQQTLTPTVCDFRVRNHGFLQGWYPWDSNVRF